MQHIRESIIKMRQNQLTVIKDEERTKFCGSCSLYRLEKANSKSGVEWVAILQSKVVLETASDHNSWYFHVYSYKLMRLQNIK